MHFPHVGLPEDFLFDTEINYNHVKISHKGIFTYV